MNDRFMFNAVVSSYYDIDTPTNYEEFEPKIYLENVDLFSDEIGIDYDRLLESVQNQLKLEKPEISQIMQYFEDNSISNSEEYITIKPDKVLQSTGLKDKNGKLIYEGDIVKRYFICRSSIGDIVEENLFTVKFEDLRFGLFQIAILKGGTDYSPFLNFDEALELEEYAEEMEEITLEVIGNIYENPELLKECENE